MRARHRVSKLLLRQGIVYYGGHAWTGTHLVWLRRQHFDAPGLQLAFDAEHEAVLQAEARRDTAVNLGIPSFSEVAGRTINTNLTRPHDNQDK